MVEINMCRIKVSCLSVRAANTLQHTDTSASPSGLCGIVSHLPSMKKISVKTAGVGFEDMAGAGTSFKAKIAKGVNQIFLFKSSRMF